MDIKKKLQKAYDYVKRNKYKKFIIFGGCYLIWIAIFDEDSLQNRWAYMQEINKLEGQIEYYKQEIQNCKQKSIELQSNDENLEKYAREQYLMKRNKEDIYIIK